MTVRSVHLDLTLSAHMMSDGSRSHCRMMSEIFKDVQHFLLPTLLRTCLLVLSFLQLWTCRTQMFSHTCSALSIRLMLQCLYWKFAVFDDALDLFVWFRLCFAFDA